MRTRIPRPDAEGLRTNLFARYLPLAGDAAFLQPPWTCVMKFNKSIIYVAWVSTFHRPLALRRMLAPAPSWGLVIDEYDLRWAAISSLMFCVSWETNECKLNLSEKKFSTLLKIEFSKMIFDSRKNHAGISSSRRMVILARHTYQEKQRWIMLESFFKTVPLTCAGGCNIVN